MLHVFTVAAALVFGLSAATGSSMAQVRPNSSEVHLYAGYLFGGDLTDRPVSGTTPSLDDDIVMGLRYAYNFTPAWAFEVSAGYNPNTVTDLEGEDVDLNLLTVDVNAVWRFRPQNRLVPYVTFGIGYAKADLDQPIHGTSDGQNVTIDDDASITANAGVGLVYYFSEHFLVRADARFRYIDKLVDRYADSLETPEATFGVGWQF
jgi:outer membrane beta-barrel protein